MATTRLKIGIGAALLAGGLWAQASETPLARLEVDGGKVGWDGIALGMSSVQAERRSGVTLGMQRANGGPTCRAYMVNVERGTLQLTFGFPSAKPGAKLQSIYVHFEGYQVAARLPVLVAELKERAPGATYLPRKGAASQSESDDPRPTYLFAGGGEYVARLAPGDGLLLTLRDCLD